MTLSMNHPWIDEIAHCVSDGVRTGDLTMDEGKAILHRWIVLLGL